MEKEKVVLVEIFQFKIIVFESKERDFKVVFDSFVELKVSGQLIFEIIFVELEFLKIEVVCLIQKLN